MVSVSLVHWVSHICTLPYVQYSAQLWIHVYIHVYSTEIEKSFLPFLPPSASSFETERLLFSSLFCLSLGGMLVIVKLLWKIHWVQMYCNMPLTAAQGNLSIWTSTQLQLVCYSTLHHILFDYVSTNIVIWARVLINGSEI